MGPAEELGLSSKCALKGDKGKAVWLDPFGKAPSGCQEVCVGGGGWELGGGQEAAQTSR